MSNKKKPPLDPDFDPTVPEEGVVVPESNESGDIFSDHLPSAEEIAASARESFGSTLPEELLQGLMRSSAEINESVRQILNAHMALGFRFGEIMRTVHRAYVVAYGDSPTTFLRAKSDAHAYIEKVHRFSQSKIRLHLDAYAKFHNNAEAVEFLRQTDMQLLLGKDLGDEIINAVIEQRKTNPALSTREVKDLIAAYRAKTDELTATREQVETGNEEIARLTSLYDLSRAEEKRLQREMEQMRLEQSRTQEAMDQLRNDYALAGQSRSALHQQLSEVERERDAALREATELRDRPPPVNDDPEARAARRRLDEQIAKMLKEANDLEERIAAQKAEEAAIAARMEEAGSALEARKQADERVNALVIEFGEFAQRYHSAQLFCTAEGNPQRYKAIFNALADVVGKFHSEIVAASKAA
ncbi:hypothetical protein M3A49_35235 [Paraburkholderia sp. CNPSo 3076]|uniref:hypothetical protein n=1 Tax=Paraburkholderia sp. CNPSo 3076 TaxID=2940936 RepID=UPI0022526CBE|nr:hypothetical protein [Paraburkholderia sp. CNPSo 3076]MCX5544660.1 hypothetical protein [Paraburkholderia sp. CNPSo 3076]